MLPSSLAAVELCFPEQVLLPVDPIQPTQQHPRACPRFQLGRRDAPERRRRRTRTTTNDAQRTTQLPCCEVVASTAGIDRLIVEYMMGEDRARAWASCRFAAAGRNRPVRCCPSRGGGIRTNTLSCRSGGIPSQRCASTDGTLRLGSTTTTRKRPHSPLTTVAVVQLESWTFD
jgi:hypothetical protein